MIRTSARKQGGAVVVTIPADVLKLRQIQAGDPLGIELTPDGFVIRKTGLPEMHAANPGPVICEPIGLRFPALYRAEVTTTLEDLKAVGLENDDPEFGLGTWAHYSLEKDGHVGFIGTHTWTQVDHILRGDQPESLLIRHHRSIEAASSYLDATMDLALGGSEEEALRGSLYKTEEGIFTCTLVPTSPAWPGPLVIYLAHVPCKRFETEPWAYAVGPEGKVFELPEYTVS